MSAEVALPMELELLQEMSPSEAGGRSASERLVDTLRSTRLTVLIGAPGSGKTRLLRDGVLPRLRRRADDLSVARLAGGATSPSERRRGTVRPRELVVWCDRWDGSPAEQVHARLDELTGASPPAPGTARPPLALRAKALSAERGARLLFVFEHGDRIVAAPLGDPGPAAEYDALVNALCSVSPSVHLLVSASDDALPPSVQSRLESPDTRALRLPDPAQRRGPPVSIGEEARRSDAGRPLRPQDVYASIADRLGTISGRDGEAVWGPGTPAPAEALSAATAARLLGEVQLDAVPTDGGGRGAPGAVPVGSSDGPDGADIAPIRGRPAVFGAGASAGPAARRFPAGRRVRTVGVVAAFFALAGLGGVLWQERADPGAWPEPSQRRVAAAATRGHIGARALGPDAGDAAPPPRDVAADAAVASLPVGASESTAPGIATAPAAADQPLVARVPASAAPLATPDTRPAPANGERGAEAPLADELWREMSLHGLPRFAVAATDGSDDALAAGRRLAVVSYDALRPLSTTPTARVVAPLFTEEMHVVVRADSPLAFIHQIAGRRIDFGPARSARHRSAVAFFERLFDRAPAASEAHAAALDAALADLLDGAIDAIIVPEPQPSAWLRGLPPAQQQRLRLLGAAPGDPSSRRALRSYLPATLQGPPAMSAPGVKTFAVMTFLVANAAPPPGRDDIATVTAQALCRSLPALRRDGHPKWRAVDPALRLPVPLPYDPQAVAVLRGCDLTASPATRAVARADNDTPQGGERE